MGSRHEANLGTSAGTRIDVRIVRRYSEGATPTRRVNAWLKLPRLAKPTSRQTSVTEPAPQASSSFARSRRVPMRS